MKRVLVTGATGTVGRAAVAALLARGVAVRALARGISGWTERLPGAEWLQLDLGAEHLTPAVSGVDAVVHLAALVHRPDVTDAEAYRRANVEQTARLLRAALEQGMPPERFVLASSTAVYGHPAGRLDELSPTLPTGEYGRSKLAAEHLVLRAGGQALRLPVVYGPGDRGNVARMLLAIRRGSFVLPVPSRERRSLLGAANAAEAFALALERGAAGQLFNVSDCEDVSLEQLVAAATRALRPSYAPPRVPLALLLAPATAGSALRRLVPTLPVPLDLGTLRTLRNGPLLCCDRARVQLGYRPVQSFDVGLAVAAAALAREAPRSRSR